MLLAGGDDKVLRLLLLHNEPHALYIVLGIAPVPEGIHISQLQVILQALGDAAGGQGDLPGDEVLPPALRLMVEQDAVDGEHSVSLPVLLHDPEAVLLGYSIGRIGMEGRGLPLGHLLHLAEELGGRGLIDLRLFGQAQDAAGLQDPQHPQGIHIAGVLRHIEGHLHMALGRQVVDLIGLSQPNDADQGRRIRQVSIVELDLPHQMVNSCGIGNRCPAGNAVDLVTLFQQEFGKVASILTGNTGNQCNFRHNITSTFREYFRFLSPILSEDSEKRNPQSCPPGGSTCTILLSYHFSRNSEGVTPSTCLKTRLK